MVRCSWSGSIIAIGARQKVHADVVRTSTAAPQPVHFTLCTWRRSSVISAGVRSRTKFLARRKAPKVM